MSQGEAWVEVEAREKRQPPAPAVQEKKVEKRAAPATAETDKQDKHDRPVKVSFDSFTSRLSAADLSPVHMYRCVLIR